MIFLNAHTHFSINPSTEIFQAELNEPKVGFYSIGIHPWNATDYSEITSQLIEANCDANLCLAIGEIGLDGLDGPAMEIQKDVFRKHIEISERKEMPVIIHCVKAWNELREIKKAMKPKQIWIYHGFAQSSIIQEVIKENLMISIGSRIINHPKRDLIIESIPNNKLLLETDDATIDIKAVYECVAEIKKISLHELSKIIEENFQNTFPKWHNGLKEQN